MLNLRPFLAIPYKHQGRDYTGADCGGGIMLFYRDVCNIVIPEFNLDYDQNWATKDNKSIFIEHYYKFFDKVEKPQLYDIVLFHNRRGIANHGGIVLNYGKFWHICREGSLVESYSDPDSRWHGRIEGFYRLKNETSR